MNQLTQAEYPFHFFHKNDFSLEWMLEEISTGYATLSDFYRKDFPVLNVGFLANKSPDLYKLGVLSRICSGEDYISDEMSEETNIHLRYMYSEEFEGDLIKTFEYLESVEFQTFGFSGFPQKDEYVERFKHDISIALDMEHIFYIEGNIEYPSLKWMNSHVNSVPQCFPFPFSKEGIERKFRNVPIVRVW